MSIRIRSVEFPNGEIGVIAICAARSIPKPGDIYLDDAIHHALSIKFSLDFASMGELTSPHAGCVEEALMECEESNNSNRTEWDRGFLGVGRVGDIQPGYADYRQRCEREGRTIPVAEYMTWLTGEQLAALHADERTAIHGEFDLV